MLSIGLLSGEYGEDGLSRAGALRFYRYPAELNRSLDELGILPCGHSHSVPSTNANEISLH
jgi:hypothetical protein